MEVAGEQPHAPLPPRPESPKAATGAGGYVEAGDLGMKEMATEEGEYGPSDSAVELLLEDDVYVGMDTYLANVPLLPMPTVVPPPPLGSCERRNCTFHAAEGVYQKSSRTVGSGNGGTGRCAGEVSAPATGECRQDGKPEAPLLGDQVCYVQLGDIVVFDHRPGQVRMPEQEERLPMAVRLVARRLLREAWLDGVAEEGLYVALTVVVGTRRRARARERVPEQHGILTTGDALGGLGAAVEGEPEGGRSEAAGQGLMSHWGCRGTSWTWEVTWRRVLCGFWLRPATHPQLLVQGRRNGARKARNGRRMCCPRMTTRSNAREAKKRPMGAGRS